MLHPDDVSYFDTLQAIGFEVAEQAQIKVKVIEPKRRPSIDGAYGLAYYWEDLISICVRSKMPAREGGAWTKNRFPHTRNLHTLAHELAHLWEWQEHQKVSHSKRFQECEAMLFILVQEVSFAFNRPTNGR
jgi:hypothetical protein